MTEPAPAGDVVDARVRSGDYRERAHDEQEGDDDVAEHVLMMLDPDLSAPVDIAGVLISGADLGEAGQSRSTTPAIACPWPMHIEAIP